MPSEIRCVREMEMVLGEGPLWLDGCGELAFVDIKGQAVHRYAHGTGALRTTALDVAPTFIVDAADGGLLVGAASAVWRLGEHGLESRVADIPQVSTNRTNDATVDRFGRLWFGTLDELETAPNGRIWCLDRGELHPTRLQAVITNGPATSPDGRLLYHADSTERTIWRSEIMGNSVCNTELFASIAPGDGYPDGVVVDSEGCLWVGLWDGWAARRYSVGGEWIDEVRFPCARITKLAFGGPDLRTAYVTSARAGLNATALAEQPLAGSLFAFSAEIPGLTPNQVVLAA